MKKTVLFAAALSLSAGAFSQQLDASNEPVIGDNIGMFVLDSFATNYTAVVGSGVTWDYSTTPGYSGMTKTVMTDDPANDPNASDFPSATKSIGIPGFLTTFFASTSSMRTSYGYTFEEPSLGTVIAKYDTDAQDIVSYPFGLGSSLTDSYSGTVTVPGFGDFAATGTGTAMIDGEGTLKLGQGTTYTNVIRYKITETTTATVPFLGSVNLVREQYEYYDFTQSNMPVFVHVRAAITGAIDTEMQLVLSSVEPDEFVGLSEANELAFEMYPNPSNGTFRVSGEFGNDATVTVFDQAGRAVYSSALAANGQEISLGAIEKGMYLVQITSQGVKNVKSLVIR